MIIVMERDYLTHFLKKESGCLFFLLSSFTLITPPLLTLSLSHHSSSPHSLSLCILLSRSRCLSLINFTIREPPSSLIDMQINVIRLALDILTAGGYSQEHSCSQHLCSLAATAHLHTHHTRPQYTLSPWFPLFSSLPPSLPLSLSSYSALLSSLFSSSDAPPPPFHLHHAPRGAV